MENKTYLGDGVYASWTGYSFALTSENGIEVLNKIYLEPEALEALNRFAKKMLGGDHAAT